MFSDELKNRLKHVHAYAVTPFEPQDLLKIDLSGFARNLEFMIERGIKIIAIAGGTGEINALTPKELEQLTRTALDVAVVASHISTTATRSTPSGRPCRASSERTLLPASSLTLSRRSSPTRILASAGVSFFTMPEIIHANLAQRFPKSEKVSILGAD